MIAMQEIYPKHEEIKKHYITNSKQDDRRPRCPQRLAPFCWISTKSLKIEEQHVEDY